MMVLQVAAATASMTWPISASLKFGVMRWPLVCALTMLPAVHSAITVARSPARKECLFTRDTLGSGRERLSLFFVTGVGFDHALVDRNIAILRTPDLFGLGGHLGNVEYQLLLTPVSGNTYTRVGR